MKENQKNEIISEILSTFKNKVIKVNISIDRVDKKREYVVITYRRENGEETCILGKETKNGFVYVSALVLTLAKIPMVQTTVHISNLSEDE